MVLKNVTFRARNRRPSL